MTSLSHDVKTPLASLVGYLEAVETKLLLERKRTNISMSHMKKPTI